MTSQDEPHKHSIKSDHSITIRPATRHDIDNLCRIEQRCFSEDAFSSRQMTYLALRARGTCLVAVQKGATAGYIALLLHEKRNNVRIYSIAVDPEFRGVGIANRLIDEAQLFARKHNRTAISLEVRSTNMAAIALYEKVGFQRTTLLRDYYHDGESGWRMIKEFA